MTLKDRLQLIHNGHGRFGDKLKYVTICNDGIHFNFKSKSAIERWSRDVSCFNNVTKDFFWSIFFIKNGFQKSERTLNGDKELALD